LIEDGGEEEERRLFYVATTRAKNELYLLHPSHFFSKGEMKTVDPSRFLAELAVEGNANLFSVERASNEGGCR